MLVVEVGRRCRLIDRGEPAERETEVGAANMRLACVGHGKNSLFTRLHAGGAGDVASSKAATHMSQQGLQ